MDQQTVDQLITAAVAAGRTTLTEIESKRALAAAGIAVAVPEFAASAEAAAEAAARIGFPVVMKVHSAAVTHKSDVGGVALNLRNAGEVRDAFARMRQALAARAPRAVFEGVVVEPQGTPGVELIVGMSRDDRFGPMVVVGLGGIFVETLKDTAMRLAPIGAREARGMIEELRGAAILRGARGQAPADLNALAALIAQVSELAAARGDIAEMDLNPVVAYADGIAVLDARIVVAPQGARRVETAAALDPERHRRRVDNLKRSFAARVVAVIGDKRAGGYMWLRAMKQFAGKLYSVQIDPNEIPGIEEMGVTNLKSLAEIAEPIDYAVSAVPRQVAPRILRDCVEHQVAGIGFFTSGFSETAEELGIKLENDLRAIASGSDIALVGPNCMGLYNPAIGVANFPDLSAGRAGDVCFISQSGTHCINFCSQAPGRGIRINKAASIGNALMLEAADYIDVMAEDPATRALGMYVEGVKDGRRFFESRGRAAARHPVVVWKGGMTEAGARATFSHTGSLATPGAVWNAMVRQSGAVAVAGLDAMLDAMEMVARGRAMTGRRMGLVAMTGGQSVVITDTFAGAGLEIPALSPASYEELASFFNIIGGSFRNPLDAGGTIGGGGVATGNLERILEILDRDSVIDAIVLEVGTGLRAQRWAAHEDELTGLLDKLAEFARKSLKPFVLIMHPAHLEELVAKGKRLARERGLVVFDSFERAAAAMRVSYDYWSGRAARGD